MAEELLDAWSAEGLLPESGPKLLARLEAIEAKDWRQFVHIKSPRTITAVHTYNPIAAGPPFVLGANAASQKVINFNADLLDGLSSAAFATSAKSIVFLASKAGTSSLAIRVTFFP